MLFGDRIDAVPGRRRPAPIGGRFPDESLYALDGPFRVVFRFDDGLSVRFVDLDLRTGRDTEALTPDDGPVLSSDLSEIPTGVGEVANIFEITFFERPAAVPPAWI